MSKAEARRLGLDVDSVAPMPTKATDQGGTKRMEPDIKRKLLEELRGGPKPRDPAEVAKLAAADIRRIMLQRRLTESLSKGDSAKAEKYRKAIAELPDAQRGLRVTDEGDWIVLNDGIGERLSKVGKSTADRTPDEQRAIAEKIFQMVDRKTAEPKTREKSKKGVNRSRQLNADSLTLTPEEAKIIESPYEILLAYDENGRLKKAILGTSNEVPLPDDVGPGFTLSHNHPSGRGPSDSDVKALLSQLGMTLRIVTVNETGKREAFELRASTRVDDGLIEKVARFYKQACDDGNDTPESRRAALVLLLERFPNIFEAGSRIFP
jgi:hypothetical protein